MQIPTRLLVATLLLALLYPISVYSQDINDDPDAVDAAKKPLPIPIINLAGSWTGTDSVTDKAGNSNTGPMTLDIQQNKKKVTSSYTLTDVDGDLDNGTTTGTISGDVYTFTFHQSNQARCHGSGVATVDDGTMSGSFVISNSPKLCGGHGSFDLKQQ